MTRFSILPIFASLACSTTQLDHPTTPGSSGATPATSGQTITPTKPRPDAPGADHRTLAQRSNAFAIDFWSQLGSKAGSQVFSPTSISSAFALTYAGARGATAAEMAKVFHFPTDGATMHAEYGKQLAAWNDPSRKAYELRVVNRLFGDAKVDFQSDYLRLTRDAYGAPLQRLDFRTSPDRSRIEVNDWVAGQTKKRITNLLPPGSVTPATRLVLTNAIYFKGTWKREFDPKRTVHADFHNGGVRVRVPLMNQESRVPYYEDAEVQVVELPYTGGDLAMDLVLPKTLGGLAAVESAMTADKFEAWTKGLSTNEVNLTMPRFKMTVGTDLGPHLTKLGLIRAFGDKADFSGISDTEALSIDRAIHKAFIEVNEEGTEAAAATGVVVGTTEAVSIPPKFFRADHPFLFMIRDVKSGTVLFMGRVSDPS